MSAVGTRMPDERTPEYLRQGVRDGIVAAVERDAERKGARTARLLVAAGGLGALGALGVTLLVSGHPFGHHPSWHVLGFTALWSALLVVCLALVFLQVQTPALPLARAARVGILGLGVAGLCGAGCPDPHFLDWWNATAAGARLAEVGGPALSAICFGLVSTLFFAAVAAWFGLVGGRRGPASAALPAAMLLLLLSPGIALQSFGKPWIVFAAWLLGSASGAWAGVALALRVRALRS